MDKPEKILELEKYYGISLDESDAFYKKNTYGLNKDRNIVYLNLDDNQISDISMLEDLNLLTHLNLAKNQISDISILGHLVSLTSLNLTNNQISDISILGHLASLTSLNLANNQISDISILGHLVSLTSLNLNNNQISDIYILGYLVSLTSLNLNNNQISDIRILNNLRYLTALNLGLNNISDILALGDLILLTDLYLSRNQISDISVLKNLTSLTSLSIWSNQISDISVLKNLKSLRSLDLWNNQISNISAIWELQQLANLDLGNNQIPDFLVLENLPSLVYLNLANNRISNILIFDDLKSLTSLDLNNNQISDISELGRITSLMHLNLGNNQISDISVLGRITSLIHLILDNNQILDISILKEIPTLISLSLDSNALYDISPIRYLKKIEKLSLSDVNTNDFLVLKNLISLKELNLDNNQISDIFFLEKLTNINILYLNNNNISNLNTLYKLGKISKITLSNNAILDLEQFKFIIEFPLLEIYANNNPCFKNQDIKFEINKNEYDIILNLLKKIDEEKNEYILPAKVLLLGNTGCGKSTLLDYVLQDKMPKEFKENLPSTHIIQVETLPKRIRKNTIPRAVFYDFGGQDYYHGLYKAFLSNDSLNILLWNKESDKNQIRIDRTDELTRDYDRNYWLYQLKFQYDKRKKLQKSFDEKMEPVLLVQTKADKKSNTKETYKGNNNNFNIINEFYLSLNLEAVQNNKMLEIEIRYFEEILDEQIKKGQIKKKEPIWYKNFLNYILRSSQKDYMQLSDLAVEYKRESDKNNLLLPEVLREIAQTGLILYYKDDADLKDIVWLNPARITKDIHKRILSKNIIKKNKGIIDKDIFDKIIKDDKIIKLLINQKVIFLDVYDNKYIIPGYLPLTEEDDKIYQLLTFDFIEPNFIMKFEYFIPFGLINQLVCFYGKGKNKKHYWRDQLLFTKDNCKVLIKLDFTNLEISISIKSKDGDKKMDRLEREIFKDILDIYWDKANPDDDKGVSGEIIKKGEPDTENSIIDKKKVTISQENLDNQFMSPEDLYISIDNKYFVKHKDLENKEKTINKITSFGLETRKEKQNEREVEVRKIDKNQISEKASGLYKNFTTNKNTENMKRIFISYAKENKKEVNEFQKQIAPFKLTKEVETWHCSELELGEDWDSKIKKKFYEADIILYFISADFFSTPFILDEEVKRGIERHVDPNDNVVLVPIILEKIHWGDLLGKYSSNFKGIPISLYDKPNNGWYEVVDDLKNAHFRKPSPDSTAGILGQSKDKMKAQEDIIEGKS